MTRRHLQRYESFHARFREAARALAEQEREPRLASATVGKRQYERWLSGKLVSKPHPDSCRVLEHMFNCTVEELFGPPDVADGEAVAADAAPPPLPQPHIGITPGVAPGSPAAGPEDHEIQQRTALRGLLDGTRAGLTAPAMEAIESVRRSMDATLTDQVGLDLLEEWERRANDYTHAYQVAPPLRQLRDALLDFTEVQSVLNRGEYGRRRERLWRLSARLAGMIGVFLLVLGQHRDARSWFHTGVRAATLCGDEGLQAWMYARSAVVSLHHGTPASAVELADKAANLRGWSPATGVRIHLVRARALARMHDRINTLVALDEARASFERLNTHETCDKTFGYTEPQFLAHTANALTNLRDTKAARPLQEQALAGFAGYGSTERLDPVLTKIDQALCMVWESDPAGACKHVANVISALPAEHRTGLVQMYALAFATALTTEQQRLRAATELRELLRSAFSCAPSAPDRLLNR